MFDACTTNAQNRPVSREQFHLDTQVMRFGLQQIHNSYFKNRSKSSFGLVSVQDHLEKVKKYVQETKSILQKNVDVAIPVIIDFDN